MPISALPGHPYLEEWDKRIVALQHENERLRAELAAERERYAKIAEMFRKRAQWSDDITSEIAAAIRKGE